MAPSRRIRSRSRSASETGKQKFTYRSLRSSLSNKRVVFSVTLGGVTSSAVLGRGRQLAGGRTDCGGRADCDMLGVKRCAGGGAFIEAGGPYARKGFGAPSSKSAANNIRKGPPIKQMMAAKAAKISTNVAFV